MQHTRLKPGLQRWQASVHVDTQVLQPVSAEFIPPHLPALARVRLLHLDPLVAGALGDHPERVALAAPLRHKLWVPAPHMYEGDSPYTRETVRTTSLLACSSGISSRCWL
jgi:hypothetical protein